MDGNKFVLERPNGEKMLVCHCDNADLDIIAKIGKELGVIKVE